MQAKTLRLLEKLIYALAAIGAVWLFAKYILRWTAPFLLSFAGAALAEAAVKPMCAHRVPRKLAAGMLTLAFIALLVLIISKAASGLVSAASELPSVLGTAADGVSDLMRSIEKTLSAYASRLGKPSEALLRTASEGMSAALAQLPQLISRKAIELAARAARSGPDAFLFAVTAGIGMYFISASFPRVTGFIKAQLPGRVQKKLGALTGQLRESFGGWLRAQIIMTLITFFELLLLFYLTKTHNAWLLAVFTAIVDALPVFGTGIVLIPMALYAMLTARTGRAIALAVGWGVITLVRSLAQAKLLGDQIGLDPLASLISLYIGWRVCGVAGMIAFPLLLVILVKLNESGTVRLWTNA